MSLELEASVRRLRLEFADELVNDAMARGSLDRCWFETKPNTRTIGDLAVSIYSASRQPHAACFPAHMIMPDINP